jgi:hypothetical protein
VGAREPVPIEGDVLVDLFHADEMRRRSALVVAGVGLAWTLTVGWQGGSRLMSVTDGDAGLHLVEPTGTGWQLVPTDATRLWRRLTTLLPADDELRAAQAVAAR